MNTSHASVVPEVAPELLRQVSGIGNLNQIARRLNQTDTLTPSERLAARH
ncbi:plasmid mobilization relaxosome protein MobC [Klebsiella pneumoniae]|nr:plasmid mobilization relaxosome protein MobC [Klebsiella pneumoniae]